MHIFILTQLLNSIIFGLLGWLLFKRKDGNLASRNMAYVIFCLSVWSFFYFFWQLMPNKQQADYLLNVLMACIVFMPVFFLQFIYHFLEKPLKKSYIIRIFNALAAYILLTTLLGYLNSGQHYPSHYINFQPKATFHFYLFLAYFAASLIYGIILLLNSYQEVSPIKKLQIKYIIGSLALAYLVNITNYLPWFGFDVPPLGNFAISIILIIAVYSLISHHLVDTRLAFKKSTIHFFSLSALVTEVLFLRLALFLFYPVNALWPNLFVIFFAIFTYPYIRKYFYTTANRYFFTPLYDSTKIIEQLSEALSKTLKLSVIFNLLGKIIRHSLHASTVAILLYDKDSNSFKDAYGSGALSKTKFVLNNSASFYNKIILPKTPIIREEIKLLLIKHKSNQELISQLKAANINIVIPMAIRNKTVGLILLGKKITGDIYNDDDVKLLKTISEQASLSIENAKLYKEVADFNRTLQDKVNKQTKEISDKAEHLQKLMEMRSEFLDIASHQLRTPVSVIKGVLSMMKEGSIPEDKKAFFIDGAVEKSTKLGEIINDILRASEMDSEKFELHNKPTDLNEIMDKIFHEKITTATVNGVKLDFEKPLAPLPLVTVDGRYIEHAITNLINNAIQYAPHGRVVVSSVIEGSRVVIRVADDGIGIPQENIKKLFQKFSRALNAVETYADGSGLGLFIIKQIVDATPGASIIIEKSQPNKGTTFALSLPISNK